jgi:hypothetical protein
LINTSHLIELLRLRVRLSPLAAWAATYRRCGFVVLRNANLGQHHFCRYFRERSSSRRAWRLWKFLMI